jgi:hypothetical protein
MFLRSLDMSQFKLTGHRKSEFPSKDEVAKMVEAVFFEFSDYSPDGTLVPGKKNRDIVIVGHDSKADMDYLQKMGVDVMVAQNFFKTIDTKDLHQGWKRADNGRSLGYVLDDQGIPYKNLHNAGNDARYTLQAMITLAVNSAAVHKPQTTHHEVKW